MGIESASRARPRRVAAALLIAVATATWAQGARAQMNLTIDQIITQLDSNVFREREIASAELIRRLKANMVTAADLAKLRNNTDAQVQGSLEVRRRIERALQEFTPRFDLVKGLLDDIATKDLGNGSILFDAATGTIQPDNAAFKTLVTRFQAVRNKVETANFAGAAEALQAMKTAAAALTEAEVASLNLVDPVGAPLNKADITARIDAAIAKVAGAKKQVEDATNGAMPGPRGGLNLAPPPGGGPLEAQILKSLSLTFTSIVQGGQLDPYLSSPTYAQADPPDGTFFVGLVYELLADDDLKIDGPVLIDLEYGEIQLVGNAATDPSLFRLVRIANGRTEFLDDGFELDTANFRVRGRYMPPSPGSGLDQFGLIGLVQVPEPAAALLLAVGVAATIGWRVRARRRAAPTS